MAVSNSWKLRGCYRGVVLNKGTKLCLNPFTLSKVIDSSNRRSRHTLANVCLLKTQASFERAYIKDR